MNKLRQLIISTTASLMVFAMGTFGYMFIEKWDLMDSIYMTALTLGSVGYSEVHPLSFNGRIFTTILIISGVGLVMYLAGVVVQFVVEGEIRAILGRRKLDKSINRLKDHYIICGYGRIGRTLCRQINEESAQIIVLEKSEELVPVLEKDKMLYIQGDASSESTLIKAGIHRAKAIVTALATDTDNVFLVLTARQLNPDIYIMARAGSQNVKSKLLAAGANRVESPYDVGAVSMALKLLRPSVSNFLDIALSRKQRAIQIEEIRISPKSKIINIMLKDSGIRQNYNLIIIAIKKKDGEMIFNPSFETFMEEGDTVIAMGRASSLKQFNEELNPQ
ncbi:TrkA1 [Desulfamplus magnetovallimortis]|uniref:TrkA1 n=1 Tax=Desulfamplus magnetovallimortis TaxID=1246637 RepID=A0A1W1HGX8_9BACT|nr:potassium channel protein [Desulfamplus magnetovallimortis]SLM31729.1 TrkA1 [Desulfamplus magnetovallimortis]